MFTNSSLVNTISYSNGQDISYDDFLRNHEMQHQRNVLCAQSQSLKSISFIDGVKAIGADFFYGTSNQDNRKQNVKMIEQRPGYKIEKKPKQKNKAKNHNSPHKQKSRFNKIETVYYTIKYWTEKESVYPFNKILKHLTTKICNNDFKKSIKCDTFDIKFIKISGLDKQEKLLSINVDITHNNNISNLEIENLANLFEKFTIYDYNNTVHFRLYHYRL